MEIQSQINVGLRNSLLNSHHTVPGERLGNQLPTELVECNASGRQSRRCLQWIVGRSRKASMRQCKQHLWYQFQRRRTGTKQVPAEPELSPVRASSGHCL